MLVLVSVPPIGLLAEERQKIFQNSKELTCITNQQEITRTKEASRKNRRHSLVKRWQTIGMVRGPGDGLIAWSRTLRPGWTESTKSTITWHKRYHSMAVLKRPWGASKRETRKRVGTAVPYWMMRSTHSSPVGACTSGCTPRASWVFASVGEGILFFP